MLQPNGAVIYRGPSMLDGAPIIVIATGLAKGSSNAKTGALIQTWILREDIAPIDSICGGCIHRGTTDGQRNIERSCYVNVWQAPQNIYKSYHRGIYPRAYGSQLAALGASRKWRLGAYGDPAAVPLWVWQTLLSRAVAWTGYTHQWRDCDIGYAQFCMASADSPADKTFANLLSYRTFRVRAANEPVLDYEATCGASKEAGHKTNCFDCVACAGNGGKAKVNIVIMAHGSAGKVNAHARRLAAAA
jgi:hypothetical protein